MAVTLDPARYAKATLPKGMAPTLAIVIDTEEEFDWTAPFSRQARGTRNLRELPRLQEVLDRHGAMPLYVIDHPVASDAAAMRWLCETRDRGACRIGAHLHPWVTPPDRESINGSNSFTCNLPGDLQLAKIVSLTDTIAAGTGERPTAFRAGRYGIGAATFEALVETGYTTDLSVAPHSRFSEQGGPSFYKWHNSPFWADTERRLLGLPVTTGFSGTLRALGPSVAPLLDNRMAHALHLPGLLAHLRLLERARLTPEGTGLAEMKRLIAALVADGERVLTLSLHSSTLLPGATVYTRDEAERDALLAALDAIISWFVSQAGGVLACVSSIDSAIRRVTPSPGLPSLKSGPVGSRQTADRWKVRP